jgi:putative CocE/NonD family hydrolase
LERSAGCRLSDGTVLRSDHYYPAGGGVAPTLLMRQPYGRDIASTVVYAHPVWFARRGYNVVIQDVRGRGGSEGSFYPFRNEGKDGAETIAWLRGRPESNGRVGMYGFSYQGATQLLAAAEQPEGLQCIAPAMTACDLYAGWFYHNGALRLASTQGWGIQMLKEDAVRLGLREARARLGAAWTNLRAQTWAMPYGEHPAYADAELPSYVRDWMEHDAPGEYWQAMDVSTRAGQIKVPALHVSGWYDTYLEGSVRGFELLRSQAGTDHARENQYLLAGPWVHIPWGDRVGESDLGAAALMNTDEVLLRWFDHWLKDKGTFADEPKVRHFAMGVNRWFAAEDWKGGETRRLYLSSGGRAESRKGDGVLVDHASGAKAPSIFATTVRPDPKGPGYPSVGGAGGWGHLSVPGLSDAPDVISYDPEVPVMSPGGAMGVAGPTDQAALEMGNNVLVYTGEALGEALHVFGAPRVVLYASTSASHVDLTAKLVRVMASGRAEFVCIGIARSTFLFGDEYRADAVQRWEFALEPTSTVFAAGERVRLEVAGGAFPLYDRNPSTSVKPSAMTEWNWGRSTHMVFHDAERPSVLELPVWRESA